MSLTPEEQQELAELEFELEAASDRSAALCAGLQEIAENTQ